MPSMKNIEIVKNLADKLGRAKSIVMLDYRGVDGVGEIKLRKMMGSEEAAEYLVAKNRLFKIALKEAKIDIDCEAVLQGPTSFIIGYADDVTLAPRLSKAFVDSSDVFELKGGILENAFADSEKIKHISNLPSREVLVSQLLAQLQSPLQRLHGCMRNNIVKLSQVLDGIKKSKEN